jgi:hypothetical protein
MGVEALGLEKYLVPVAIAEAVDLVLDRRTIARPLRIDRAGEQRRAIEPRADRVVRGGVGSGHAAMELRQRRDLRVIGDIVHGPRRWAARRRRAQSIVRPSRRGGVPVFRRPSAVRVRAIAPQGELRRLAYPPAGFALLAAEDPAAKEGAGGQHDGAAG